MKDVGELYGIKVTTSFTDMNQPLGNTAGLWCEVVESIECLKGNGQDDIMNVVYYLGREALEMAGVRDPMAKLKMAISDGSALKTFNKMVEAHGGGLNSLNNLNIHEPKFREMFYAKSDGYISFMNTLSLGMAVVQLGGGRLTKGDILDPSAGIIFHKKIGDIVSEGELLLEYYCSGKDKFETGKLYFHDVIQIQTQKPKLRKLIIK